MGETQKRYRVTYQGKDSRQYVTLLARSPEEARQLADASQTRRHDRFPLTFARMEADPQLKGKALEAEVEKRQRDQDRYDSGELKVVNVEEMKVNGLVRAFH